MCTTDQLRVSLDVLDHLVSPSALDELVSLSALGQLWDVLHSHPLVSSPEVNTELVTHIVSMVQLFAYITQKVRSLPVTYLNRSNHYSDR